MQWRTFNEEDGLVVFAVGNDMPDVDGNGPYSVPSWTLLEYAGNNQWSREEDIYNPDAMLKMLVGCAMPQASHFPPPKSTLDQVLQRRGALRFLHRDQRGIPMARTDDDTWDINESVGATALGVAGGRAKETQSADPLISDPYAKLFLDAAGDGIWRVYLDDELPAELVELDPQFEDRMQAMLGYTACRTKFFDEYFLAATRDGIRQVVILAAGLDSRAWRLAWPAG
ncbi:MAG TPA: SAM-dependent methyltransferase, partial [Galbitalea sp.]|nr:SAM-dependent methyltransferase [Galbitalea sp.]